MPLQTPAAICIVSIWTVHNRNRAAGLPSCAGCSLLSRPTGSSVFLDLFQAVARWMKPKYDGLYTILAYESTLELLDGQGQRALARKHQQVRFLQNDITAFEDIVYGDGDIFAGYTIAPGEAVDCYRDGDRWHVLVSLRQTKNRGDVDDFYVERMVQDGFLREEEWWQIELRHPVQRLSLTVLFPRARHCRTASMNRRSRHQTSELGAEYWTVLPDGRQQLRWEAKEIEPLEIFTLRWTW